ncbi:MAG: L,D-transpeptidase family protein, partial [Alphaproteobacteria bacterium]
HVRVNIPEFHLRVVHNGQPIHDTRVVVGKTTNKTPVFSDEMEHMIVNPYWNVPVSILRNEMLPGLRRNPRGYVAKRGYEVLAISGGRARKVDPGSVNWSAAAPGKYRIRQRPGVRNALGRIKFIFPNKHSVYLHDTPSKSLFSKDRRAFSHGCVRVQNPFDFAEALLVSEPKWSGAQLRKMSSGKQRRIKLDKKIPVHLSYFTLTADASGGLSTFPDIYGYDGRMRKALGL